MLLLEFVLSNTDLDEKTDQIQVTVNKRKYKNVEYDDNIIEYLMKYLGLESYEQLQDFLKHNHIPIYN
jgi:hypothetical protein